MKTVGRFLAEYTVSLLRRWYSSNPPKREPQYHALRKFLHPLGTKEIRRDSIVVIAVGLRVGMSGI